MIGWYSFIVNLLGSDQKIKNCLECGMVMPDEFGNSNYCPGCQKKPEIQSKIVEDNRFNQKLTGCIIAGLIGVILGGYFGGFWGGLAGLFISIFLLSVTSLGIIIGSIAYVLFYFGVFIISLSLIVGMVWFIVKLVNIM